MTNVLYNRIVNAASAAAVIGLVLHDRVGEFGWIALLVTVASAVVGVWAYFRYHWSSAVQQSRQNGVNGELTVPAKGRAQVQAKEESVGKAPAKTSSEESTPVTRVSVPLEQAHFDALLREVKSHHEVALFALLTQLEKREWDSGRVGAAIALLECQPFPLPKDLVFGKLTFSGRSAGLHLRKKVVSSKASVSTGSLQDLSAFALASKAIH